MKENVSHVSSVPRQPLLQGINLARFLCDECPFYKLRQDGGLLDDSRTKLQVGGPSPLHSLPQDRALPSDPGDCNHPGNTNRQLATTSSERPPYVKGETSR